MSEKVHRVNKGAGSPDLGAAPAVGTSLARAQESSPSGYLLKLDNGQFCLYPNNRMRVYDNSLTPQEPLQPDFKVSTVEYQVENGNRTRLGDTDEYFWKTKDE